MSRTAPGKVRCVTCGKPEPWAARMAERSPLQHVPHFYACTADCHHEWVAKRWPEAFPETQHSEV